MSHGPYKEYVVDGATLSCSFLAVSDNGEASSTSLSGVGLIKLKAEDNRKIKIQRKAACTEQDKTTEPTKDPFICKKTGKKCVPKLLEWINLRGKAANVKTQESHYLLLDDAKIDCEEGGKLTIEKSGQVSSVNIPGPGVIELPKWAREFGFIMDEPLSTVFGVGNYKPGSSNLSTLSVLYANGLDLKNTISINGASTMEGTQVNAFRHSMWQALITNEYGEKTAKRIGNAHEHNPLSLNQALKASEGELVVCKLLSISEADELIDLQNNIIGRNVGKSFDKSTKNDSLAKELLRIYHEEGLYEAIPYKDTDFVNVERVKINDDVYQSALEYIDEGLDPNNIDRQNERDSPIL